MADSDRGERKTAIKTPELQAPSPLTGKQLPAGAHAGNSGGKPGRSGRKPAEYHQFLRDALSSDKAKQQIEEVLEDKNHPAFASLVGKIIPHAHGQATQKIEIGGKLLLDDITGLRGTNSLPGEELTDYEVLPASDQDEPDEKG